MSQIEESMRRAMERSGMTRYRLWRVTGIGQSQLSRFMKGTAGLSYEAMERLADALGLIVVLLPKTKGVGGNRAGKGSSTDGRRTRRSKNKR